MSNRYWRKRATKFEKEWNARCEETVEKRLARHYQKALSSIKDDILKLYATFAKDNGMDFAEARRSISSREFREWRMSMQEYLQRIVDGDKGLELELNTLAMRPRINRLEKLYGETLQELDNLGRNVNKSMKDFLSGAYTDNYHRNIFDFVKIGGMSVALSKIDNLGVEKVLATRWSGKNYSERIWNNTRLLSGALKNTIANGVHRGLSIPQMSRLIEDKMHAGYSNAVRLVRTEMNFVNNQAHYDSMTDAGIESYEFIAVLDNRTTPTCRTRDGEVYLMEEKSVGLNYPPMHARCRSTVAPFIEGVSRKGTRVARDKNGRNIDIPAAMKYKDYESVYIKKEKSLETWKQEQREKSAVGGRSESKLDSKIEKLDLSNTNLRGLAANDNVNKVVDFSHPHLIGSITDRSRIMDTLKFFEKQIVNFDVENAIVITTSNEVYRCVGDKNNLTSIIELGEKLKGAYVTHNHPIGSNNEYSFSKLDITTFMIYQLEVLRGIDEKFVYELNRNSWDLDVDNFNVEDSTIIQAGYANRHITVIKRAKEFGIGYRRWLR